MTPRRVGIAWRTNQVSHQSISVIVIIERESFSVRRHLKKFRTIPVNLKLELGFYSIFMVTLMALCTVERNAIFLMIQPKRVREFIPSVHATLLMDKIVRVATVLMDWKKRCRIAQQIWIIEGCAMSV